MSRERRQPKTKVKRTGGRLRDILARALLLAIVLAVTGSVLYLAALPFQYTIREGDVGTDIKALRDIEDRYTTEKNRQAARDNVEDKYRQDDNVTKDVIAKIEQCFLAMDDVRAFGQSALETVIAERQQAIEAYNEQERIRTEREAAPPAPAGTGAATVKPTPSPTPAPTPVPIDDPIEYTNEFIDECGDMLPISFTREDIIHLVTLAEGEYERLKDVVSQLVSTAMKSGIKSEYLQNRVSQMNSELVSPVHGFSQQTQRLGMNIISSYMQANFLYDKEATEAARDQAEAAVPKIVYRKGQNIVREGEPVTHAQYLMLEELGLIRKEGVDWRILSGLIAFTLLILSATALCLMLFERETLADIRRFSVLCLIHLLVLLTAWGANQIHPSLQPMGMGVLLVAVLINRRSALILNILWAVIAAFLSGGGRSGISTEALALTASVLVSGALGIYMVSHSPQRTTFLYAGVAMGAVGAVILGAFDLMSRIGWQPLLLSAAMGFAAGIVASFFAIGTMPLWESAFGLVTPMKLLELANPNQPLLKRLLLEAPGSYHHSIIVGNLAESAAEAIGADVLLARAGAYYHDIGKLSRPYFFGENQIGPENPHDSISPELSTRIITAHIRDGLALAREHRLPAPIRDAIVQHHGTTAVSYFYHKMKEASQNKDEVDIQDFRYEGPKPQTREAAILMLADSVEAAVRSLNKPSPQKVEELIRSIIRGKMDDGQFSECPLTLRDLEVIVRAFRTTLNGVFHDRIEYPNFGGGEEGHAP
ncbi:MAG: HD family phosphohydrolase [Christensenellales bacterium]|jgi:putative nucleotidyltransferase with HDIG domain